MRLDQDALPGKQADKPTTSGLSVDIVAQHGEHCNAGETSRLACLHGADFALQTGQESDEHCVG